MPGQGTTGAAWMGACQDPLVQPEMKVTDFQMPQKSRTCRAHGNRAGAVAATDLHPLALPGQVWLVVFCQAQRLPVAAHHSPGVPAVRSIQLVACGKRCGREWGGRAGMRQMVVPGRSRRELSVQPATTCACQPTLPPARPPNHPARPPMRSTTRPVAPPFVPSTRQRVMISRSTASKECTRAAATLSSSCKTVAGGPSPAAAGPGRPGTAGGAGWLQAATAMLLTLCCHLTMHYRPHRSTASPSPHTCAGAHCALCRQHVVQAVCGVVGG
jgi:hypothetical protein